jgi:hypothetical protein
MTLALDIGLPKDVLLFAPFAWNTGLDRDSMSPWTTPLGPAWRRGIRRGRSQDQGEASHPHETTLTLRAPMENIQAVERYASEGLLFAASTRDTMTFDTRLS